MEFLGEVNICVSLQEKKGRTRDGCYDGGEDGSEASGHWERTVGITDEGGGEGTLSGDYKTGSDEGKEGYPRGHRKREGGGKERREGQWEKDIWWKKKPRQRMTSIGHDLASVNVIPTGGMFTERTLVVRDLFRVFPLKSQGFSFSTRKRNLFDTAARFLPLQKNGEHRLAPALSHFETHCHSLTKHASMSRDLHLEVLPFLEYNLFFFLFLSSTHFKDSLYCPLASLFSLFIRKSLPRFREYI